MGDNKIACAPEGLLKPNKPDHGHDTTKAAVPDETVPLLSHERQTDSYQSIVQSIGTEQIDHEQTFTAPGNDPEEPHGASKENGKRRPWASLAILLIGVFVSQLDTTLVLATYSNVASSFDELKSGSWLLSSYAIAQCAVTPLYGKLSDIYSRKACILVAYALFAGGTLGCGLSRSMVDLVLCRMIQGTGAAGMVSVVAILITDLFPKKEVPVVRSYLNVLQTVGRSCGGVVGGFLTQAVGWRWSFLVQVPPIMVSLVLVGSFLRPALPASGAATPETAWTKLKRIDFVGALFLLLSIIGLCLLLDLNGSRLAWTSPEIAGLSGATAVTLIAFVVSACYVPNPIFPLRLLRNGSLVANYAIVFFMVTCQLSLMAAVPLFVQVTEGKSAAAAGAHLIPSIVGNTLGGLITGACIKRSSYSKPATVSSTLISLCGSTALIFGWNGDGVGLLRSLLVFPSGLATGIVMTSTFVAMVAAVPKESIAVATSGMYLFSGLGAIAGISVGNVVSRAAVELSLEDALSGYPNKRQLIERAISDLEFVRKAEPWLRPILQASYTKGFHAVNLLGLVCGAIALVAALISRGNRLESDEE